mmetsp:Transcript_2235/g.3076  ORF Transcript_2235/g.3076 Transcript_2235/m.3076 type:complete len:146 (-) Transcript_2235:14-451(-)
MGGKSRNLLSSDTLLRLNENLNMLGLQNNTTIDICSESESAKSNTNDDPSENTKSPASGFFEWFQCCIIGNYSPAQNVRESGPKKTRVQFKDIQQSQRKDNKHVQHSQQKSPTKEQRYMSNHPNQPKKFRCLSVDTSEEYDPYMY